MIKYQYKVVEIFKSLSMRELSKMLDEEGKEGWLLCTAEIEDDIGSKVKTFIFARELK